MGTEDSFVWMQGIEPDKLLDRKTENIILFLGECCPGPEVSGAKRTDVLS